MKIRSSFKSHFWIIAILVAGVGYLFVLQYLTPDSVYFSGDSGLKAMLSQNLAKGDLSFSLEFPDQPWINALWQDGLFPYQEPYVYHLAGKYYITFPYTFSLVTAPFYTFLGYRGLYVIPGLATLVIWLVFYRMCKKLDLSAVAVAIGTIFLIFASNLTLYSAIYSEHTLAVCLSFAGLSLVFPEKNLKNISFLAAFWAGVLSGLAVWFRPEQIFLVVFLDLLSLWAVVKLRWSLCSNKFSGLSMIPDYIGRFGWVYVVSSFLTLLLYGLTNWLIYKNLFGIHTVQVIEGQPLLERVLAAILNFQLITVGYYSLFATMPITLFSLGYLYFSWVKPAQVPYEQKWTIWYVFSLTFIIGVAVSVPAGAGGKQWGPRFLLLLVPVLILLFTWQLDHFLKIQANQNKTLKWIGLGLVLILGGLGIVQNLLFGTDFLARTYAQIKPAVEVLQAKAETELVIAISDPFIGQVLQPAVSRSAVFMRAEDTDQLAKLSEALLDQNRDAFTYICYSDNCGLFSQVVKTKQVERNGKGYVLQTVNSGKYGKYILFNIRVGRSD
jgi:hypothetical protein